MNLMKMRASLKPRECKVIYNLKKKKITWIWKNFYILKEEIQVLRTKSSSISIEFTKIIRRTDKGIWQHIPHTVRKLLNYIRSVINDFNESISYHTSRVATSGLNSTSTSLSTLQILINSHTLKVTIVIIIIKW